MYKTIPYIYIKQNHTLYLWNTPLNQRPNHTSHPFSLPQNEPTAIQNTIQSTITISTLSTIQSIPTASIPCPCHLTKPFPTTSSKIKFQLISSPALAVLFHPESTLNNRIPSSGTRSAAPRHDRKSEQRTTIVKLRTIRITCCQYTMWSYGCPPRQRPFTYNVILMMAPSQRAVITQGLFYYPNHKLSTPQFIKNLIQFTASQGGCRASWSPS